MSKLKSNHEASLGEVHESVDTTKPAKGFRKILAFMGPAYLVSVGYMDPGNWATDLQGGSSFGYQLIWVLLMSNLMALVLQSLSARLGIVARRDLAQANREMYPKGTNFCLYILAELAIAATDLAEVLGMAIGIHLLTGIPILWGVLITVLDTFILLILQKYGIRKMEAFIIALIATIGLSFLIQLIMAKPDMAEVAKGFIPTALNDKALYIAVGIIGATVMPHNLYLHSALVQTRKIKSDPTSIKKALKYNFMDSAIALNAAFLVNAAILILAASTFFTQGDAVARIEDAHKLLEPRLGSTLAPIFFAVALIAAGQSSTVTGTLAGQIVMEGYLHIRLNPWVRRLLTRVVAIIPAVIVILVFGDNELDDLLILSQVILSMQLGFAIIPLIHFVSDKKLMGQFAIKWHIKVLAWIITTVLVFLNVRLVMDEIKDLYHMEGYVFVKIIVLLAALGFVTLFFVMTIYPIMKKRRMRAAEMSIHGEEVPLINIGVSKPEKVAVALDFNKNDEKIIAHAVAQGTDNTTFLLIHIVETVSAGYLGETADDQETRKDLQRLENYAAQLTSLGYNINIQLGYKNRIKEIVRIVKEEKADMLVMGAHRHYWLKDFIYGQTVEQVRHKLNIPILIVN